MKNQQEKKERLETNNKRGHCSCHGTSGNRNINTPTDVCDRRMFNLGHFQSMQVLNRREEKEGKKKQVGNCCFEKKKKRRKKEKNIIQSKQEFQLIEKEDFHIFLIE